VLDHLARIIKHEHAQQALRRNQGFIFGHQMVSMRAHLAVQPERNEQPLEWGLVAGMDIQMLALPGRGFRLPVQVNKLVERKAACSHLELFSRLMDC
jgi:hypothetical protein